MVADELGDIVYQSRGISIVYIVKRIARSEGDVVPLAP